MTNTKNSTVAGSESIHADNIPDGYCSAELDPLQLGIYRGMTPVRKLRIASDMYWFARELKAVCPQQNPECTEEEVLNEGREVFLYAAS